jgi:hypothetical protein
MDPQCRTRPLHYPIIAYIFQSRFPKSRNDLAAPNATAPFPAALFKDEAMI